MSAQPIFTVTAAPDDPDDTALITENKVRTWRIHREDADPEHRFTAYRLAAGWFANLPAYAVRSEEMHA